MRSRSPLTLAFLCPGLAHCSITRYLHFTFYLLKVLVKIVLLIVGVACFGHPPSYFFIFSSLARFVVPNLAALDFALIALNLDSFCFQPCIELLLNLHWNVIITFQWSYIELSFHLHWTCAETAFYLAFKLSAILLHLAFTLHLTCIQSALSAFLSP